MKSKKIVFIFFSIFVFFLLITNISANVAPNISPIAPNNTKEPEVICSVGATDGLLYASEWNFNVSRTQLPSSKEYTYFWRFDYSVTKICPVTGCSGDGWGTTQAGIGLSSLSSNSAYRNIFSNNTDGVSGVYTDSGLKSLLENGNCPKYIYVGSSAKKQQIGFIFASKEITEAKQYLEEAGYTVEFEQNGGDSLQLEYKKLYEDQVKEMKANIEEFKKKNYGTVYSEECVKVSKFGQMTVGENTVINYYDKYRQQLFNVNHSYDFSSGDKVLEEYKTYKCASKPANNSSSNKDSNLGEEQYGCDVVPSEVKKWIEILLNFVKYVALILVVVLGTLDFIKAASSGEADSMKKAGQSFLKRVIAVIILFLLPMIVELILDLINLYGSTGNCFGVLK